MEAKSRPPESGSESSERFDRGSGYAVASGGKLRHITRHLKGAPLEDRRFAPGTVFGLHLCSLTARQVAAMVLSAPRAVEQGVGVIATANIQHVAAMRRNQAFAEAMTDADLVTCDGFPVLRYARVRGADVHCRTTGRDIVDVLMTKITIRAAQRLYFLVDSDETAVALGKWRHDRELDAQVTFEVAPPRFVANEEFCREFSNRVASFKTNVLLLCVGAPQSEIFCHLYRKILPPCWALCVGQSAKIVLGLAPKPPQWVERANIEWLWRMWLEPKRLVSRYVGSTIGYMAAILEDQELLRPRTR